MGAYFRIRALDQFDSSLTSNMYQKVLRKVCGKAQRALLPRFLSTENASLPLNLEESGCSQKREVSLAQANRVFGSGFLTHQDNVREFQASSTNRVDEVIQHLERDRRLEFYQLSAVSISMQTNVPEPFKAEDEVLDHLKEGLPSGLSDSQVNLEARSNMDCRLDVEKINYAL